MPPRIRKRITFNQSAEIRARTKRVRPLPVELRDRDPIVWDQLPKHPTFDSMWTEHQRLAYHAAYTIGRERGVDPRELFGVMVYKFNYALHYFNPEHGCKFSTFFWRFLRTWVETLHLRFESERRAVEWSLRNRDDTQWQEVLTNYAYHEQNRRLYRPPERDSDWTKQIIDEFADGRECWTFLCKELHPREREALELYYEGGFTHGEIAEHWGVSKQRVEQVKSRALERVRTRLAKLEKWLHLFKDGLKPQEDRQ